MTPSTTSMYDCTHGPKKDCHACLVGELVTVLTEMIYWFGSDGFVPSAKSWDEGKPQACKVKARAVLEKAKEIKDCIPIEDAPEAAASQERWR